VRKTGPSPSAVGKYHRCQIPVLLQLIDLSSHKVNSAVCFEQAVLLLLTGIPC
jgi:hypothetical protein